MQRNGTSTIIRRLSLALSFVVMTHIAARLIWHWQWFGVNGGSPDCTNGCRTTSPIKPITSFGEYTSDFSSQLGTHFLGAIMALVILKAILWMFFDGTGRPDCTNPNCKCNMHGPEEFNDGKWGFGVCMNRNCTCRYHTVDEFVDGRWE